LRGLIAAIRADAFDAAALLTNSLRSALVAWLARIPRRAGYARDGRGWLLTDRLRPLRRNGAFVPTPITPYYAAIVERLGAPAPDLRLRLGVTPAQEAAARALREHYGIGGERRYAVVNPGAAFGAAKCWLPERFAAVCRGLRRGLDLTPVIVGGPGEHALMRAVAEKAGGEAVCCVSPGTTLGSLKGLIRDASVLVCNDSGPRHYGVAFGVPTVTIFGPTDQRWTDTGYNGEVKLQAAVDCGPCQLRTCPLDHRCMRQIGEEQVLAAVRGLLRDRAAGEQEQPALVAALGPPPAPGG
jgi:heptosyltransferase-2